MGGPGGVLEPQPCILAESLSNKSCWAPQLRGVDHLFGPQIWKDLGLVSFWSHGASLPRGVYNTKVVVNVPNSAWPQGQGIGLKEPAGPWKANVWLSTQTLLI